MGSKNTCILSLLVFLSGWLSAQQPERPLIWVRPGERSAILEKIERQDWAQKIYSDFINQLDGDIKGHQTDPALFLQDLPFDWEKKQPDRYPPFHLTYHTENGDHKNLDNATDEEMAQARTLIRYLQLGIDCGMAYYLTEEEKYAQCATDILYSFIKGVLRSEVSDWQGRGGWLFPDDGFREVREIGYKVPLIYDFIAAFIKKGGRPYDLVKKEKTDFPINEAQAVFRTYADITINYGMIRSNHPILEAPNLVYNALAMEDGKERERLLSYFLTKNTAHQDALNEMAAMYKEKGDLWPETSQYLNAAASILTRLMLVVNKYDPGLRLGDKYANLLFSLPALDYLVYPNNQLIRWGDGKRTGTPPYSSYEEAYLLGEMDSARRITDEFGPLLTRAINQGRYERDGMLAVLWYDREFKGKEAKLLLPRTDKVDHAGIFLQRNLSASQNPNDGLMCFVGGAHMVHGHAEGMNIELYGKGEVLGVDNGRGRYQQDIHENYSRIFAAHNTVIVNGNSRSDGGWVNLGINSVQLLAMEPMPKELALSPYHSFSTTSFIDDKGEQAEAYQERTLALIRTSDTTGYYVDVFRSRSKLPDQYHDYLYHNIGDRLEILNGDVSLKPTPDRYMANAGLPWVQNQEYRHPGWHFFEDVHSTGEYKKKVRARFIAEKFEKPVYMDLHLPADESREYTQVLAPPTFEAPAPYEDKPTPTLVIRKTGEAWTQPFVVVFEPFEGNPENHSIQSVEKLEQDGKFRGIRVQSFAAGKGLVQYIITQVKGERYNNDDLGISFIGSFAVITETSAGKLQNIYIGEGEELRYGYINVKPAFPDRSLYREFR
ncbi:heparinase II/III family protein [Cyclobacterium sp.]|uniref:heparinase II/III domain-containing protein n=1 Tax=Cyclobacterium sp. TaxID=1966343 RepID=UPI0019C20A65|nr:heparinase II/III family protein [Cyclobacterium sp.]MBD3628565.1 heparinase II/III family protein [Cyclobacterium sp.]